jgi:nitroreductase
MEQVLVRRIPDAGEAIRERERAKPLRAPVVIAVTSAPGVDDIETIENYAAACAAIENLLLAAHDLGLAAHWRTGDVAYSGEAKVWLGVQGGGHIAGFIYVGHAADPGKARPRIPAREKTEWRE